MKLIAIGDSTHVLRKTANLCSSSTSDLHNLFGSLSESAILPQRYTKHGQQSVTQAGRGLYRVRQRLSNAYVSPDGEHQSVD